MIIPSTEPFFLPGGSVGCLLVHGFTGTPKEMRWMGEYLSQRGIAALGVRLAGHATQPEDLAHVRWQDWLASVEDGWHLLRGACERVFIAGLSMGGVLALLLAARTPVSGVIAMSTPFDLPPDPRRRYIRLLRHFLRQVPKGPPDWRDEAAAKDHIHYPDYPVEGLIQLSALLAEMRACLPEVKTPALLIHSRDDGGVDPGDMPRIYAALGSAEKNMLWLENSGHVITRDAQRATVFQAALDFIQRLCAERQ